MQFLIAAAITIAAAYVWWNESLGPGTGPWVAGFLVVVAAYWVWQAVVTIKALREFRRIWDEMDRIDRKMKW